MLPVILGLADPETDADLSYVQGFDVAEGHQFVAACDPIGRCIQVFNRLPEEALQRMTALHALIACLWSEEPPKGTALEVRHVVQTDQGVPDLTAELRSSG